MWEPIRPLSSRASGTESWERRSEITAPVISRGARGARGGTQRGGLLARRELDAIHGSSECRALGFFGRGGRSLHPMSCISGSALAKGGLDAAHKSLGGVRSDALYAATR